MTRFRVRRGAVVAVLLVLAFGVAAALGVQAYRTAGDHRAQADRVLRDYARPVHKRTVYDTSWHMGTVLGQPNGDRRYVAYTVLRDSDGVLRTALGFETKPTVLTPLVVEATDSKKFALLPRPLTGGVQYDS